MIETLGYIKTSNAIGGFKNLKKILGDDFFTKERKIDMISDIASGYDDFGRGTLFLDEFNIEMNIGGEQFDDGCHHESYITYVDKNGGVYIQTWEYDEHGWMMDEPIDSAYYKLEDLDDWYTNDLLEILTNKFL